MSRSPLRMRPPTRASRSRTVIAWAGSLSRRSAMIASPMNNSSGNWWICVPPRTLCSGASTWLPACSRMCTPRAIWPAPPGASCSLITSMANCMSLVNPAGVRIAKFFGSSSRLMSTMKKSGGSMGRPLGVPELTPRARNGQVGRTVARSVAGHRLAACQLRPAAFGPFGQVSASPDRSHFRRNAPLAGAASSASASTSCSRAERAASLPILSNPCSRRSECGLASSARGVSSGPTCCEAVALPSNSASNGTASTPEIAERRLGPTRFAPFSYFCTCWNVTPMRRPSSVCEKFCCSRQMRMFCPTRTSIGIGLFVATSSFPLCPQSLPAPPLGRVGGHLDFQKVVFPELGDADDGPRRQIASEMLHPHLVEDGQVFIDVKDVAGRLEAMLEAAAGGREHGVEVGERLHGLRLESARHHLVALLGIARRGARTEHQVAELHRLNQRCARHGGLIGMDDFLHHTGPGSSGGIARLTNRRGQQLT